MSRRYEDEDPVGEWEFREDLRIARDLASRRDVYPVPSATTMEPIVEPGIYRHTATGTLYEVIGMGRLEDTLTPMVIYRRQDEPTQLWMRTPGNWCRPNNDGTTRYVPVREAE